jgi:hypothetical protein
MSYLPLQTLYLVLITSKLSIFLTISYKKKPVINCLNFFHNKQKRRRYNYWLISCFLNIIIWSYGYNIYKYKFCTWKTATQNIISNIYSILIEWFGVWIWTNTWSFITIMDFQCINILQLLHYYICTS